MINPARRCTAVKVDRVCIGVTEQHNKGYDREVELHGVDKMPVVAKKSQAIRVPRVKLGNRSVLGGRNDI
jgi:hypothetical protein